MIRTFIEPPALGPGARVALISPAGALRDRSELERAVDNARALGWDAVVGAHALDRAGYFAGPDADRAADLAATLADPSVDGVWCTRGGYGAMRLLARVDLASLRHRPRAVLGFSDITVLHAAIGVKAGIVSYHGPTGRSSLTAFSRASLVRALVERSDPCGAAPDAMSLRRGRADGRLAGGNLALLAALCGTPYFPDLDGAILVLEDVNEPVYRVDRMLQQLLLAGVLRGVRGIAFGHCTDCDEQTTEGGARTLADVVREVADALSVPCLLGLPVGHIDDQWTLPLGAHAEMDADSPALHVR